MSTQREPCGACKYMRRECEPECVFAAYFPPENVQGFACVHLVFGAENVGNLLKQYSDKSYRDGVMKTLVYQAEARARDPVHGCIGFITQLENKLHKLEMELQTAKKELYAYISPQDLEELLANPAGMMMLPPPGFPWNGKLSIPQPPLQDLAREDAANENQPMEDESEGSNSMGTSA